MIYCLGIIKGDCIDPPGLKTFPSLSLGTDGARIAHSQGGVSVLLDPDEPRKFAISDISGPAVTFSWERPGDIITCQPYHLVRTVASAPSELQLLCSKPLPPSNASAIQLQANEAPRSFRIWETMSNRHD